MMMDIKGRNGLRPAIGLSLLALSLAACSPADRVVTGSTYPMDYRDRHPIVLADGARTLDVFPGRGRAALDDRQNEDVRSFAVEYVALGRGGITAIVPRGDAHVQHAMSGIRSALAKGGVHGGPIAVATYEPADPHVAAPIRLTFKTLKAQVGSQCGQWPQDLGSGPTIDGWKNRPYWNLGCATQSNVANQIADPLDLVRGRPEGRIDTLKRAKGIDSLRNAKDPSTQYNSEGAQINQAVGVQ